MSYDKNCYYLNLDDLAILILTVPFYLFAAVDAVFSEDRGAACGHPDSGQRVAVNLILLNHALAFLML